MNILDTTRLGYGNGLSVGTASGPCNTGLNGRARLFGIVNVKQLVDGDDMELYVGSVCVGRLDAVGTADGNRDGKAVVIDASVISMTVKFDYVGFVVVPVMDVGFGIDTDVVPTVMHPQYKLLVNGADGQIFGSINPIIPPPTTANYHLLAL